MLACRRAGLFRHFFLSYLLAAQFTPGRAAASLLLDPVRHREPKPTAIRDGVSTAILRSSKLWCATPNRMSARVKRRRANGGAAVVSN
jgi:hypothetical protein